MKGKILTLFIAAFFLMAGLVTVAIPVTADDSCVETLSIGYWKNHPNEVSVLFIEIDPIIFGMKSAGGGMVNMEISEEQALLLLNYQCPNTYWKVGCNGYIKLGGQLVAAELNIANGACSDECVDEAIDGAREALSNMPGPYYNAVSWFFLDEEDQTHILELMETLEDFNSGH